MNQEKNENIEQFIDKVSKKFGYDEELNAQLKRIVPIMMEDKTDDVKKLLCDTLNRVKIFVLDGNPTNDDVERCKKEVIGDINSHVKFIQESRGEYDSRGVAAGAYINEPVFDKNMNIIDRKGLIYVTKLSKYDALSKVYGTRINLSHLIHELGHAWASEKEEYIQNKNGSFLTTVGAYINEVEVDKDKKEVREKSYDGLMLEEGLNTIEEENTLCKLLGIESIKDIRSQGYVPSNYQGMMTDIMKSYVEKFGKERFDKFRILKDREAVKEIEESIKNTEAWQIIQTEEYTKKKKSKFDKINELEVTDGAKNIINKIVNEYNEDYFPDNSKFSPMQKLENVFTQIYNFSTARYNFGIVGNDHNMDIYKEIMTAIISEGYVLKNQAKDLSGKEDKRIEENNFASKLKSQVKSDNEIYIEEKYNNREIEKEKNIEVNPNEII